ncbi:MAG: CAP domain-containing protein [Oligoflexia bacterium]|nr:CAP domain-containing protein [Oligoflexia bacterium]
MIPLLSAPILGLLLGSTAAPAAYGVPSTDPYSTGFPSSAERELHLWTNAARVDPEAFRDTYVKAGCSFDDFEATEQVAHDPLYLDMGLAEATRFHSADMDATGNFSHDSSDGTSFSERLAQYYSGGMFGENIAVGYGTPWNTMMLGWMCSSGHRANIMSDYNELGTGIVGEYYTQDFGVGELDSTGPVAMGAHTPQDPSDSADFMADWLNAAAPVRLAVVLDRAMTDLELLYGTDTRGVFATTLALEPIDCHLYYFTWETADGTTGTFPEQGSYTFGGGCTDGIGWVPDQADPMGGLGGLPGDGAGHEGLGGSSGDGAPYLSSPKLIGCSAVPASKTQPRLAGLGGLLLLLGIIRRRRGLVG